MASKKPPILIEAALKSHSQRKLRQPLCKGDISLLLRFLPWLDLGIRHAENQFKVCVIMSADKNTPPPHTNNAKNNAREDALRANLLKRKQQQRARTQTENTVPPTDKEKK